MLLMQCLGLSIYLSRDMRMNPDDRKYGHMDLVVGSFGTIHRLFTSNKLNRKYVTEIALDEIDTLVDDTFKDGLMHLLKLFGRSGLGLLTGNKCTIKGPLKLYI